MPDIHQQVHELLADIRAAATALEDPTTPFGGAFEAGARAYARGPAAALFVTAQIAARRLDLASQARAAVGERAAPFPRERLERVLRVRPHGKRRDSERAVVDYFEGFVDSLVPEPEPLDELIATHGYPDFGAMLRLANETAAMLVENDPNFSDIDELFRLEALADESEWHSLPDQLG